MVNDSPGRQPLSGNGNRGEGVGRDTHDPERDVASLSTFADIAVFAKNTHTNFLMHDRVCNGMMISYD